MSHRVLALLAFAATIVAACRPSSAPSPMAAESGAFVVRLGNDTVGVDQFTRVGNRIEGQFVQRAPRTIVSRYVITLGANGLPATYELSQRLPDGSVVPNGARSYSTFFSS